MLAHAVAEFWRHLADAKEDSQGFLVLSNGTTFPMSEVQGQNCVYVRKWYKTLYDEMISTSSEGKTIRFLVTGRPGIVV